MDAKLTLKLNKEIIEMAKKYAKSRNKSLSRMVETYLKSMVSKDLSESDSTIQLSPFVKSMRSGVRVPNDFDLKKAYGDRQSRKHS